MVHYTARKELIAFNGMGEEPIRRHEIPAKQERHVAIDGHESERETRVEIEPLIRGESTHGCDHSSVDSGGLQPGRKCATGKQLRRSLPVLRSGVYVSIWATWSSSVLPGCQRTSIGTSKPLPNIAAIDWMPREHTPKPGSNE